MFDDGQHLREDANLARLLLHYAGLVQEDRTVWQDRLMELDGLAAAALAKLHGDLIAADWLEINVGSPSGKRPGAVESSYRITPSGLRALKQLQGSSASDEVSTPATSAPAARSAPRRAPHFIKRQRAAEKV